MTTKRKEIRNEIVDILKRHNIVNRREIRANRSGVYESDNLPGISVYTRADDIASELSQAPRLVKRHLDLAVEVVVRDDNDEDAADTLDDLCEEIEHVLTSDDSLDCKADDIELMRTDFEYISENIDKPVHSAIMLWKVTYQTFMPRDRSEQDTADFKGVDAEWQIGHHDEEPTMEEADRPKDTIDLPQI